MRNLPQNEMVKYADITAYNHNFESQILPTFIIIGAAKSGTTALYEYMAQHPQVFMSAVKEPHYFCYEGRDLSFGGPPTPLTSRSVTQPEAYLNLFKNAAGFKAIGEASPFYMYLPQTASHIHAKIPYIKLVVILRNPVERAFSNYQFLVRDGREPLDFRAGLDAEAQRIAENWEPIWHYTRLGFYTEQLKRYYALFDRRQLQVILYDDFQRAPLPVIQSIFRFIGVDDTFQPDMSYRSNPSGRPKSYLLHYLTVYPNVLMSIFKNLIPKTARREIKQFIYKNNLQKIPFDPAVRAESTKMYRIEILRLQDLLKCDLSTWLDNNS